MNVNIGLTSSLQNLEDLSVGLVGDGGLALQVVSLDSISGGDAVLVQQQAQPRVLREVEHLLRLTLDDELAEFVATN